MLVGNTHLCAGGADDVPLVIALLENEGIRTRGNPDVHARVYKQFSIEDARELRSRANAKALGEGPRVFIVAAAAIQPEAQNALLKTLEEPPADALFFFVVPSPDTLLPTLRSRMQLLSLDAMPAPAGIDVRAFLAASAQARLTMLAPLLERGDDDKRDLGAIIGFLAALERALRARPEALHPVYLARKYIGDKGALVKPLLEQVALLVPHV